MLKEEFAIIFLYIAMFGFSDYLVKKWKLKDTSYLLFYALVLCVGFLVYFNVNKNKNTELIK